MSKPILGAVEGEKLAHKVAQQEQLSPEELAQLLLIYSMMMRELDDRITKLENKP